MALIGNAPNNELSHSQYSRVRALNTECHFVIGVDWRDARFKIIVTLKLTCDKVSMHISSSFTLGIEYQRMHIA